MPIIYRKTFIHAPIHRCFDVARTVDVHSGKFLLTTQYPVKGILTGVMELEDFVTWEAMHFGLKQRLTSHITRMEKPTFFQDEMMHGTFKSFTHQHIFIEYQNGTMMIDHFDYMSPLGCLGQVADALFLKHYMRSFIKLQAENVKRVVEKELHLRIQ